MFMHHSRAIAIKKSWKLCPDMVKGKLNGCSRIIIYSNIIRTEINFPVPLCLQQVNAQELRIYSTNEQFKNAQRQCLISTDL